jgi:hypothetical protein
VEIHKNQPQIYICEKPGKKSIKLDKIWRKSSENLVKSDENRPKIYLQPDEPRPHAHVAHHDLPEKLKPAN